MNAKKVIALLKANLWSLLTLVLSLGIGGGAVVWASGEREKVESTLAERAKVVNQLDGFHRGNLDLELVRIRLNDCLDVTLQFILPLPRLRQLVFEPHHDS